ncbi:Aste57867_4525 [Aphanomyces stellatus]|uniref:Aste57867_4525 protein n=1 Tax=Aphanomyces stellatus TaxID=120398 RepID=A0A485KG14_9STRA|nr:hypothetical protein As57867_004512 [Aphanomyces stellatus]VFT81635.1 Aste57867_4525 [Aphanomyces stellatus]
MACANVLCSTALFSTLTRYQDGLPRHMLQLTHAALPNSDLLSALPTLPPNALLTAHLADMVYTHAIMDDWYASHGLAHCLETMIVVVHASPDRRLVLRDLIVFEAALNGRVNVFQWLTLHADLWGGIPHRARALDDYYVEAVVALAASQAHVDVLDALDLDHVIAFGEVALATALHLGHAALAQRCIRWQPSVVHDGALDDDVHPSIHEAMLQWYIDTISPVLTTKAMDTAAWRGDVALLVWLDAQDGITGWSHETMARARAAGQVDAVSFLEAHRYADCVAPPPAMQE